MCVKLRWRSFGPILKGGKEDAVQALESVVVSSRLVARLMGQVSPDIVGKMKVCIEEIVAHAGVTSGGEEGDGSDEAPLPPR
jgi:hypothetical protein